LWQRIEAIKKCCLKLDAPDWLYAASTTATFAWSSLFGAQAPFVASGQQVMLTFGGESDRLSD
jgi:hypothetical protein